jgi:hypothetical protein
MLGIIDHLSQQNRSSYIILNDLALPLPFLRLGEELKHSSHVSNNYRWLESMLLLGPFLDSAAPRLAAFLGEFVASTRFPLLQAAPAALSTPSFLVAAFSIVFILVFILLLGRVQFPVLLERRRNNVD